MLSYKASLIKEVEKDKLKEIILDEHLNSYYIRRELQLITGSYKEKTRENIRSYLLKFSESLQQRLDQDYVNSFSGWQGNLYKITRSYEKWLNNRLYQELSEIILKEEKSFELLNNVKKHLSFYLKSFRERLNENLREILGVEISQEEWQLTINELRQPDISLSRSFDFHLDMLWFLFPMFIFRKVFKQYFQSRIPYEIEKNLHRLTSGLNEKVNKEIDSLMFQALVYINHELKTIDKLLTEKAGESKNILDEINKIKRLSKINQL